MLDRYYNAITKSADLWVRCFGVDDISWQIKLQSVRNRSPFGVSSTVKLGDKELFGHLKIVP